LSEFSNSLKNLVQRYLFSLSIIGQKKYFTQVFEMTAKRHNVSAVAEDLPGLLAAKHVDKDVAEVIACFVSDLLWLEWLEGGGQAVLDSLKSFHAWSAGDSTDSPLPSDNWRHVEENVCPCFRCLVGVGCGNDEIAFRQYRRF
jgi:hypothetical protein